MSQPLPVESPITGLFWSWIVPLLLFALSFAATWWLYRHFAGKDDPR